MGSENSVLLASGVAVGRGNSIAAGPVFGAMAVGQDNSVSGSFGAVAVGKENQSIDSVVFGRDSYAYKSGNVLFGQNQSANSTGNTIFGFNQGANTGNDNVIFGEDNAVSGAGSGNIIIGAGISTNGNQNTLLGDNLATANLSNLMAVGAHGVGKAAFLTSAKTQGNVYDLIAACSGVPGAIVMYNGGLGFIPVLSRITFSPGKYTISGVDWTTATPFSFEANQGNGTAIAHRLVLIEVN